MNYISADFHFFHANIIRFCNRPYKDLDDMHQDIIQKINNLPDGSILYHLGDFCFGNITKLENILNRIKPTIQLCFIYGNHDVNMIKGKSLLDSLPNIIDHTYYKKISVLCTSVILFHFPIFQWEKKHRGAIHLHGHSHGSLTYPPGLTRIRDVGIDSTNYEIRKIDDHVAELLKEDMPVAVDHH